MRSRVREFVQTSSVAEIVNVDELIRLRRTSAQKGILAEQTVLFGLAREVRSHRIKVFSDLRKARSQKPKRTG